MHEEFFISLQPSIGSPHFLDCLLDPHYAGNNLNASEKTECLLFAKEKCSQSVMPAVV